MIILFSERKKCGQFRNNLGGNSNELDSDGTLLDETHYLTCQYFAWTNMFVQKKNSGSAALQKHSVKKEIRFVAL